MKGLPFKETKLRIRMQPYGTKRVASTQHGAGCYISKKTELLSSPMDLWSVRK